MIRWLRLRSIGKCGFRSSIEIRISDFAIEHEIRKRVGFQCRISWISFPFDCEIRKSICKTVLVNNGVLFVNDACACKTAVERYKWKSKNRYLSMISALKSGFGFRVRFAFAFDSRSFIHSFLPSFLHSFIHSFILSLYWSKFIIFLTVAHGRSTLWFIHP